jgi:hypothetical protein
MQFLSTNMIRVMLAVSVSFWMTGAACIWGCNNNALAAAAREHQQTARSLNGRSCHSSESSTHHCCSGKSSKEVASNAQSANLGGLEASTEALMNEYPLAVIATAVVFKAKTHSADTTQTSVVNLPGVDKDVHPQRFHFAPIQAFTRGPTYLRCCVFLI